MLTLEIIGAGFASASRPEDVAAANRRLVDFKRRTQQRYLDNSIGFGLTALADAITSTGLPQDKIDAAPQRAGLLLATRSGPVPTRESYLESYLSRGKRSVSATLFSNCGYNIVGALLARSHNLRGPVLCFGAGGAWSWLLLTTARRMFAAGRVDHLFIGEVASDRAMILALAPAGRIVAAAPMHRAFTERGEDRGIADYVIEPGGAAAPIIGRLVDRGLHDELTGEAYAVIDGVDGRAHHVRFRGIEAFEQSPPLGGIVEVRRFGGPDDPRPTLVLAPRSDFGLKAQVTAPGATWLDHRLVEREPMPLSLGGFGAEVREAMAARTEHLIEQGLAHRQNQRVIFQRDLLATLRRRELDAVGAELAGKTGLAYQTAEAGEHVAGTYRQRLMLTSGRFAMIDNGLGFQLVPWSREIEKKLGQHLAGITKSGGGIEWGLERKRDLGI